MQILAGTGGFSYKEWKGSFYPADLPAARMLPYFAERLPTVELNNTFYRLPKPGQLAAWAAQVPESFRFSVKASQRITHIRRLKDAASETSYLLTATAELGDRLGAVLFQTPPNLKLDLPRFELFLATLPPGTPAAFEFRHASWRDDAVLAALRERDFAWCVADMDGEPEAEVLRTASWGYARLRRVLYEPADLARWLQRFRASGWERLYLYFKHEDAGTGPRLAAEFLRLAAVV